MRLRVATWNLENLDERSPVPLAQRLAALQPTLRALDADVVCLQEVGAERHASQGPRRLGLLDALLAGTPYAGFHRFAAGLPSGGLCDVHNQVVLSRWALRRARVVSHELVRPPVSPLAKGAGAEAYPWDRPLLQVEVALPEGRPLHLIAAHLRAPRAAVIAGQKDGPGRWRTSAAWAEGFFLAGAKRTGQALEARLLVEACFDADPDARVLVAGDLNAEADETTVRILQASVDDTGNPELAPRQLTSLCARLPEAQRYSLLHHGRGQLVDHLLGSPALAAAHVATRIFNQGLEDEGALPRDANPAGSFHAAVLVELELGGEPRLPYARTSSVLE